MSLFYKLGASMGFVVLISNYLVQFPINHFGLSEVLTYGAFTYPITFLITDLANRAYGKTVARKIVYIGFFIGVLTLLDKYRGLRCYLRSDRPQRVPAYCQELHRRQVELWNCRRKSKSKGFESKYGHCGG